MMSVAGIILRNQLFYIRKVLLTVFLTGLMMFIPIAAVVLTNHIKGLAERPLQSLQTELILQNDRNGGKAEEIRTTGTILPFDLQAFPLNTTRERLKDIDEIRQYSSALVLWQFDLNNTRTLIALNTDEPQVGLRKIESFLMPGGRFFSGNDAREVILERHFAKLYQYEVNNAFELAGRKYTIAGIVDFKEQSNLSTASIFLPYETGLKLSGQKEPVVNQVFISLRSSSDMTAVSHKVEDLFPGYSLITRDSLLKNLSSFNQFLYRFGSAFVLTVLPVSLLLIVWILKIYRLDFQYQADILRTLGWPKKDIFTWLFYDTAIVAGAGLVLALVLAIFLTGGLLPMLQNAPMLDQGFKL
jgi:cell division protein FtsX